MSVVVQNDRNIGNQGNKGKRGTPSIWVVHIAFIAAQVSFGGSSVVGSLGLPATNPVLFAMIREGIAGPLLCLISYIITRSIPSIYDYKLFILPGIMLYLNQLFYIVGLKLSDSITAAAFQPSQPILACIFGFCLGTEKHFDVYKILGIIIAFGGALVMILFGQHEDGSNVSIWNRFGGIICFIINCSATVFYLILNKPALKIYDSITVTSYSYIIASILMVISQLIVALSNTLLDNLCSDCNGAWDVPVNTIYALIYWVLFTSVLSYLLITWGNKYSDPSINLAYSVLQPATSAFVSALLIGFNIVPKCVVDSDNNPSNCLYDVDYADLGAIGIALGLLLVVYSDKKQKNKENITINAEESLINKHNIPSISDGISNEKSYKNNFA